MSRERRDPGSLSELQRRLTAAAEVRASTVTRLQSLVANTILCQMLPESAVKGGSMLKLRLGDELTRATPDVDAAYRGERVAFLDELRANLAAGWGSFTGTATWRAQRPPQGVPSAYVMQPMTVKLSYRRRPFKTIDLEVGYDELEATTVEPPERAIADEVLQLFSDLGLESPEPVRVLPVHHQIAQKLHACTEAGNDRAHDLVDLQLLAPLADPVLVAATARRLFTFRRQHLWPSPVVPGRNWATLYALAADGLDVLDDVHAAVTWANDYIAVLADK